MEQMRMDKGSMRQTLMNQENREQMQMSQENADAGKKEPVSCLGMDFESDEARRAFFLEKLRQGLENLQEKLGGIPFTTAADAVARIKSAEKWPSGSEEQLREVAERMLESARYGSPEDRKKDLLQLWKDEIGFPKGEPEDILHLSDPPYYTACPNPFVGDFIKFYGKPYEPDQPYHREPFAVDVSEGKTDALYKAHSYHTKVPHLAIIPSILHYTKPGDIVLDGFCGSGMTGVAAQMCGTDDSKLRAKIEQKFKDYGLEKPEWGARRAVLNDLSPVATFISAGYNLPFDVDKFEKEARRILNEVEEELGWMYETLHTDGKTKGRIEYTVWSEVFNCPECLGEIIFLEEALDDESKRVKDEFSCPHCNSLLSKKNLERCYVSRFDPVLNETIKKLKREPSIIVYKIGKNRYEKKPDALDLELLKKIEQIPLPSEVPTIKIPPMHMTHQRAKMDRAGVTYIHHFFKPRSIHALATLWRKANEISDNHIQKMLLFTFEQSIWGLSILNRYQPIQHGRPGGSQVNRQMTGVYYIASQIAECSPIYNIEGKISRLGKAFRINPSNQNNFIANTGSASFLFLQNESIDYIFTDPPFGENIYYADLNFLTESWHRIFTNAKSEAIIDKFKEKRLVEYQELMRQCFSEYYRVLKPGRWMTIVFHNSQNAVWNAIQEALQSAGFVVADVRILDKKQGSYRQVTSDAVKQDLIISAYKPNDGLEHRFELSAGTEQGAWDFIHTHLKKLPVFVSKNNQAEVMAERQNYLLYDRMVAFHVQRGVIVPLSAAEFYAGLSLRFPERESMFFLPEQIPEYDKKRMKTESILQLELFVTNEISAIQWLRQELGKKPQTFQELHPGFIKAIGGWSKNEEPIELSTLLEQNFLRFEGKGPIPPQIVSWMKKSSELRKIMQNEIAAGNAEENSTGLITHHTSLITHSKDRWYIPDPNKAGDLEKIREKSLLKEFQHCRESKNRRLKVFRMEAIHAGFKNAWQAKDYRTIIEVARKIPESILQEDQKLLMWYDQALIRTGEDA